MILTIYSGSYCDSQLRCGCAEFELEGHARNAFANQWTERLRKEFTIPHYQRIVASV